MNFKYMDFVIKQFNRASGQILYMSLLYNQNQEKSNIFN